MPELLMANSVVVDGEFLLEWWEYFDYHITDYLHRAQLLRMPSIYHELVIFTDILFMT